MCVETHTGRLVCGFSWTIEVGRPTSPVVFLRVSSAADLTSQLITMRGMKTRKTFRIRTNYRFAPRELILENDRFDIMNWWQDYIQVVFLRVYIVIPIESETWTCEWSNGEESQVLLGIGQKRNYTSSTMWEETSWCFGSSGGETQHAGDSHMPEKSPYRGGTRDHEQPKPSKPGW